MTQSLLRAADRGVRVRILVDDGDTVPGDEQIVALTVHPNIEIRVFNPFVYRGHVEFIRATEFAFNANRLDYRMHNVALPRDFRSHHRSADGNDPGTCGVASRPRHSVAAIVPTQPARPRH